MIQDSDKCIMGWSSLYFFGGLPLPPLDEFIMEDQLVVLFIYLFVVYLMMLFQ
jgi:hypothetical protein